METLDLILEIVRDIKTDVNNIKDNYVKKVDCFNKVKIKENE